MPSLLSNCLRYKYRPISICSIPSKCPIIFSVHILDKNVLYPQEGEIITLWNSVLFQKRMSAWETDIRSSTSWDVPKPISIKEGFHQVSCVTSKKTVYLSVCLSVSLLSPPSFSLSLSIIHFCIIYPTKMLELPMKAQSGGLWTLHSPAE